ncbi:pentatricopeptide repeat-containing protein At1g09220, mitochondrial [Andrographis paniculata]|uniref:pentatricopeptide repeat-containing protein At1g09220, mitochondrial n=1 Tax=Andrographis paniculata TaxID=175694 RepID=UPI0021E99C6F|nr:pentatricopeptide repeat-containing protein At1g09220, mitochondrial [Andrographis paniculata]XP_051116856.1 pentatricopeptide repeat-containing protein At1g09220, mitochondrial [Andrographis paniculata]
MERIRLGNQLHCSSFKAGFDSHIHVQTALVDMYVDCGSLLDAQNVFDEMPNKVLVTWNVLLTGFVKSGDVRSAQTIFDAMPARNVVSWTGLIDGYTRANRYYEALSLFRRMVVDEGIPPNGVTLLAIFPTIANTGSLELCRMIHAYGEKSGLNTSDIRLVNSLIYTYANCGSIESARRVFEGVVVTRRNLVSWTTIISGFAMHGMASEALELFTRMESGGKRANGITFLSILNACSHGGLVDEGIAFFNKMVDEYGIEATVKHYGALIDMLGRAGRLEEAERMVSNVGGNVVIWRTVLGACHSHGNVELGERVMRKIMEAEGRYGGDYVLLSNILSASGRFGESERLRSTMVQRNVSRVAAVSSV